MPHLLFAKAAMAAAALALSLFAILESLTPWGDKLIGALSTIAAASFAYLAVLAKNRFDERQKQRDIQHSTHSTDVTSLLAREKLADDRIRDLFLQQEKVHSEQIKSLESQVMLARELFEQGKAIVEQQRELITQQAATIQQLRK